MWWKKRGAQSSSVQDLPLLIGGLERGMCDNALVTKVFSELDSTPETLLPAAMPKLAQTAFLLWKCGRSEFANRLLFTCLDWYLTKSKDQEEIASITQNIQYMFDKDGHLWSEKEIHDAARSGRFSHAASWRMDIAGLENPQRVLEVSGGTATMERTRFAKGFTPLVSAKLPLTTFQGWLKRLDPAVLNATGRLVLEHVFPMFGELTPEQYIARSERLAALNVALSAEELSDLATLRKLTSEGVQVKMRRHRRFSGGDGLLPRACYGSLCKNAAGDDAGSLSRELLAYVDARIPGMVYVGDSTSARLNAALGNSIGVLPGFCATYVLLFAPDNPDGRAIFDAMYGAALGQPPATDQTVNAFAFETRVDQCTIENVIDLRLPDTQRWFFEHFKNGDGHFLVKEGGTARAFYDLVPTLLHPALGGTDVSHAIGSWMRSSGVNGLVFPSARSDASATIRNGELVDWHGWNFVDYRTARSLPATEVTNSPGGWPNFLQPDVQLAVASGGELAGSWKAIGLQARYDHLRESIEGPRGDGAPQPEPHVVVAPPAQGGGETGPPADIGPTS